MKKTEVIGTGATVEEAKQDALNKLGVNEKFVEFEVLKQPTKKVLGIFGGSEAEVKAVAVIPDYNEKVKKFLTCVLDKFEIGNLDLKMEESEDCLKFDISGDDLGAIIGYHGETLAAIQYIVGLVSNKNREDFLPVRINVGDYREKREKSLKITARRTAEKVLKYRRNFSLEPMNAYERRVIHTTIQDIKGVRSWSEGERYRRHVIIGPDNTH